MVNEFQLIVSSSYKSTKVCFSGGGIVRPLCLKHNMQLVCAFEASAK
jgi:hypothetical protein